MKFIRPNGINDTTFTSSTAFETPPAAYNAGTVYGAGDTASTGTPGGVITCWESLQAANTGNTPASSPLWWVSRGETRSVWDSGTAWAQGDQVVDVATHRIYESLQAANTNHPVTDIAWWLDIAPTNPWAMFDEKVGTVTTVPNSLAVVLEPGRINSLAVLGLDASQITVTLVANAETVYSATRDLLDNSGVGDWYTYFYEPIYQRTDLVITDLIDAALLEIPAYGEGVLTVTFTRTGGNVSVGTFVAGLITEIGFIEYGAKVGIRDYSRKEADDFGNYTLVKRSYSKTMSGTVTVAAGSVDTISKHLTRHRATNCVWVASDQYGALVIYGFLTDWSAAIEGPYHTVFNIEVEGMT